ncbi:conserved hypothetical protein [Methylocella tundrae]|jgi:hypothetical protein|uniref:Protein AaeX n=1 Tax=Methylocella tundrae TaxID=227605 RepID=A0A4U8Z2K4_METTU|nr:DUF1656 domain-containing protein [Methylocella tundrae]WPP03474.1 DUF1656 domain-containing protein [Methylocella tundrae]VFU09565.1 conserved protein of unknown function [Methylocella tundrae]VTZ21503.1 conserved hypothetical protein [Methylocella tundrae]VTZ48179.1 conserved hypothetical protein [Methylocella tundrae]
MTQEIDVYGVFIPALLVWMACAFALSASLRRLFAALGFYKLIWHPPLFDLSLFVASLGCVVFILPGIAP